MLASSKTLECIVDMMKGSRFAKVQVRDKNVCVIVNWSTQARSPSGDVDPGKQIGTRGERMSVSLLYCEATSAECVMATVIQCKGWTVIGTLALDIGRE